MTSRDLQIFLAVAQFESMSRAAAYLHITQPSVSLAITALEREFSVMLFERTSRRLHLTKTGRDFIRYAKNLLAMQQVTQDFLKNEAQSSHIRIGATATVGSCLITPIVSALLLEYPQLRHEAYIANTHIIEEKLLDNNLDIALVEGRVHSSELVEEAAVRDDMVLICAKDHPFSGRAAVALSELAGQPLILREEGSGTRAQIEECFRSCGLGCNVIWSCYQFVAIKEAVCHGLGVSILSKRLVEREVADGDLWACNLDGGDLSRTFNLVYHRDKYFTKQMTSFADICRRAGRTDAEPDDAAVERK